MADDARSLPNTALLETSFLYGANATFVEEMHEKFLNDPNSVDPSWRSFFQQLRDDPSAIRAISSGGIRLPSLSGKSDPSTRKIGGSPAFK